MIQIANLVTTCSFYQTLLVFNWKGQKKLGTYLIHSFINVQTVQAVASLIFIKRERTDIRTIFITSVVIVLKIFVQIKRFPTQCTRGLNGINYETAFDIFITFSDSSIKICK